MQITHLIRQNSEFFDIITLLSIIAKLSDLMNSPVFGPPVYFLALPLRASAAPHPPRYTPLHCVPQWLRQSVAISARLCLHLMAVYTSK